MRKIGISVRRLNDHLADHEWLAGGMYSLADICNYAIAGGMQFGFAELVNKDDAPHLVRWIEQIAERAAVKEIYAKVPLEKIGKQD
ncbi:MAG: glutathione binding-like protein [Sphingomonadaceae bacterium]